jgi:hypothetical protein
MTSVYMFGFHYPPVPPELTGTPTAMMTGALSFPRVGRPT